MRLLHSLSSPPPSPLPLSPLRTILSLSRTAAASTNPSSSSATTTVTVSPLNPYLLLLRRYRCTTGISSPSPPFDYLGRRSFAVRCASSVSPSGHTVEWNEPVSEVGDGDAVDEKSSVSVKAYFFSTRMNNVNYKQIGALNRNVKLCHTSAGSCEEACSEMVKLGRSLRSVDLVDGKLVDIGDNARIFDPDVERKMHTYKELVRGFLGSDSVQRKLERHSRVLSAGSKCALYDCFSKPSERQPMVVSSLKDVSDYLNVSAQQRKVVRLNTCRQVTQERIWTATLGQILLELRTDLDYLYENLPSSNINMGRQIVINCLDFVSDSDVPCDEESTSWMRLGPAKALECPALRKWEDVLEMFGDLINSLKDEDGLFNHVKKLEAMKEGLSQIRDVLVDKRIGYREARYQEILVQKKLTKTLGHPSQCLFTLLVYYLYGRVRDIEVDICGGIRGNVAQNKFCLCMGKILSSNEEKMVCRGVKQLNRALELFKFVWETAEMKGQLELRGHIWCAEAEDRILTYRGNKFFVYGITV